MCDCCIQRMALEHLPGRFADWEKELEEFTFLHREVIRLYRPAAGNDRGQILRLWRNLDAAQEQQVTALLLWLHDGDRLFLDQLTGIRLEGYGQEAQTLEGDVLADDHALLQALRKWYRSAGRRLMRAKLARVTRHPSPVPEAPMLALALWLGGVVEPGHCVWRAAAMRAWKEAACQQDSLWLAREARLALWRAGIQPRITGEDLRDDEFTMVYWLGFEDPAARNLGTGSEWPDPWPLVALPHSRGLPLRRGAAPCGLIP